MKIASSCTHMHLHRLEPSSDNSCYTEDEAGLDALCQKIQAIVDRHTKNHIWQQDSFRVVNSSRHNLPWASKSGFKSHGRCLWGEVCFGDNIEDEWLIVWLLVELSKQHQLSVRVWDSDGDFLLIHAAYALPKWLKPDLAENRVWIRDGKIHLIPLPSAAYPTIPSQPTVKQALDILQSEIQTVAPTTLQACIAAKLAEFPGKLETNIHQASAVLPVKLASLLQQEPQMIAPAVLDFYYRDPEDLKAARAQTHFPSSWESVQTVVAFSRCLYAQMVTQQYQPPRSVMLPLPSDPLFPAAILGAKITAGFEMLLASLSRRNQDADPVSVLNASKRLRPHWEAYQKRLDMEGFFCGEMDGSAKHKALLQKAAEMFHSSHSRGDQTPQEPAQRCAELLSRNEAFNKDKLGKAQSDAWLAEGKMELEQELKAREAETKDNLSSQFQSFLEKDSEIEGINTVDELLAKFTTMNEEDKQVDFDSESFLREMQQALSLGPEGDDASSEEGSSFYGDFSDGDGEGNWEDEGNLQDFSEIDSILQNGFMHHDFSNRGENISKPAEGKRKYQQYVHPETQPAVPPKDSKATQADWDACTATDSDDAESQEKDSFDEAYENALRADYREHQPPVEDGMLGEGADDGDDLTPVDLDVNLMQNLLSSFKAQEGLSGPVGNLAGILGLNLHADPTG